MLPAQGYSLPKWGNITKPSGLIRIVHENGITMLHGLAWKPEPVPVAILSPSTVLGNKYVLTAPVEKLNSFQTDCNFETDQPRASGL